MIEDFRGQDSATGVDRIPLELNAFIWFDRRDSVWRGLARELSLFAQGESAKQVEESLRRLSEDYIADAIHQNLILEMIPRPVPRIEWWKLMAYGQWLTVEALFSNLIHRRPDGDHPAQHRMIPC